MASAQDYANWIVQNADKKGTPEFETVAQAYKAAKTRVAPEEEGALKRVVGGALEPLATLATGMVAQPLAGLAGLGTAAGNLFGMTKAEPADAVRKTAETLTYHPKTEGGKDAMSVIGYLPEKLGELADRSGGAASDATGSPAIGAIVNTLMNALPAAAGAKVPSLVKTPTLAGTADSVSTGLYRSALKPTIKDVRNGNADRAIETLRDEGLNVSRGGAEKLSERVDGLNDQVSDAIAGSTARVDKAKVANSLQDLIQQMEKQVNPQGDVAAVTKAYDDFTNHPLLPGADMPVQLAQDMKKGTYRGLKDKYGQMGSADTEAQKTLARGLKEEIAQAVPEVGPLNARESELLNAQKLLERRVAVNGNHNPMGIASVAPGGIERILAALLDRSDTAKSMLGRGLNPGENGAALSDLMAPAASQTFSEDQQKRQAMIAALMGRPQ
jgi:hypothetical protein